MKRILFTSIFIISLYSTSYSQSGWFAQTSPSSKYFTSVYFVNPNTGYVGGDTLLKTTNGGANWFTQTTGYSGAVFFQNANTGFIGYIDNSVRGIEMTTNAGLNWNMTVNTYPLGINSISFINSLTGWAAAGAQFTGTIYKTTDGGMSWVGAYSALGQDIVQFLNPNTGYAVNFYWTLFKSTNGGNNWVVANAPIHGSGAFAIDTNIIYAGGQSGRIAKSTNGCLSWDSLNTGSNSTFYTIYFLNANTGFAVGSSNTIVATTNGGANWVTQYSSATGDLFGIFFINSSTGWAVGDNGIILKTTTGGVFVGLQPLNENIPSRLVLHQNYPNPFNPSTVIRFDIPSDVKRQTSNVKLIIYDVTGKEVAALINEQLNPGDYEINWDASNSPSGVYFARLSAGSYSETMKMTLLK